MKFSEENIWLLVYWRSASSLSLLLSWNMLSSTMLPVQTHRFLFPMHWWSYKIQSVDFFFWGRSRLIVGNCSGWRSGSRRSKWSWTSAPSTPSTWRSRTTVDLFQWWQFIPFLSINFPHPSCRHAILLLVCYGKMHDLGILSWLYTQNILIPFEKSIVFLPRKGVFS